MVGSTTPRSLKDLVLADLRRAQRLIARIDDEIDLQFRIASAEGDWWIALTLPDDLGERRRYFSLVSDFMALKSSPAFVLAVELKEPDAVCAVGVSHKEVFGAVSAIERRPLSFSPVTWIDRSAIDDDTLALLPRGRRELSAKRVAEIDAWFGPEGKFPAMKIGNE